MKQTLPQQVLVSSIMSSTTNWPSWPTSAGRWSAFGNIGLEVDATTTNSFTGQFCSPSGHFPRRLGTQYRITPQWLWSWELLRRAAVDDAYGIRTRPLTGIGSMPLAPICFEDNYSGPGLRAGSIWARPAWTPEGASDRPEWREFSVKFDQFCGRQYQVAVLAAASFQVPEMIYTFTGMLTFSP